MPAPQKKATRKIPTSLEALHTNLDKRYGGRVVRREEVKPYEIIPTGSLSLDLATRVGGWVRGRIHEIVGPEGVGKTSQMIASMVSAQRKYPDLAVGFIDMEQTFDYDWAEAWGLDTSKKRWLHLQPDDSEDVSDMLAYQTETGLFSMVTVDSIGGMESKQAFDKEAGDVVMGRNAQVITRMVKKSAVLARRGGVAIMLVNQFRANVSNPQGFDIPAGPKALKYSTTMRVDMSPASGEPIKYKIPGDEEETVIGRLLRARVVRNKVAVQGKKAEYYLINYATPEFGPIGIDQADEAMTIGLYTEVIEQRGSWFYFNDADGKQIGFQGGQKAMAHLRSCPDDLEALRLASLATMSGDVVKDVQTVLEHAPDEKEAPAKKTAKKAAAKKAVATK